MANTIGNRTLFTETLGRSIQLSADGAPKYKAGGVTVNWATGVPAISGSDVTYEDGVVVKVGEKALRYGTVLMRDTDGTYRVALAADGANLKRGETYLVNETWLEEDNMSAHPGVIDGGRVFKARILSGGAYPSIAQIEAAMPGILYALD